MRLAYDRLENAHRSGRWAELGMHHQFTHSWFSRVQRKLLHRSTDRLRQILSDVARVCVQLHSYKGSRRQIGRSYVLTAVQNACSNERRITFLRVIRHCNLVFHQVTRIIKLRLPAFSQYPWHWDHIPDPRQHRSGHEHLK